MLKSLYSTVTLFLILFSSTFCIGQVNISFQSFDLLPSSSFEYIFNSVEKPNGIYSSFDPSLLDGSIEFAFIGEDRYRLEFNVSANFTGHTFLVVQYFANVDGIVEERYSELELKVVEGYVRSVHDYVNIDLNSGYVTVDVLNNDIYTGEDLNLSSVILSENIDANIFMNNIAVKPKFGFTGTAYCQYVIENDQGVKDIGTLTIQVEPEITNLDTLFFTTVNTNSLDLLFPSANVTIVGNGFSFGELVLKDDGSIKYFPNPNQLGVDIALFEIEGSSDRFYVEIDNREDPNVLKSLRKDVVFTAIDREVNFNVLANDFKPNNTVVSYSNELIYLGDGDFSFIPDSGYSGVRKFNYTSTDGIIEESGEIIIHINNFYPETKGTYHLVTEESMPLTLDYNIPIDGFSFEIISDPENGRIEIGGDDGYEHRCGLIQASGLVIYQPDVNFYGIDNFDLRYCVEGYCRNIKIEVEVLESKVSCHCIGPDCVWPGDANHDGKVNVTDILPLGYYMGESGVSRLSNNPTKWTGQQSENWVLNQNNGENLKFADVNGDGFIDVSDLEGLNSNYDKYSKVVPNKSFEIKNYPIDLELSANEVSKGEWLSIDIVLGNDQFPVLDAHGISYTLEIASGVIDSSSAIIVHHSESWIGYNSPTLEFGNQMTDGVFDLGISRTTGKSVSGQGITQSLGFIAEEDFEGVEIINQLEEIEVPVYLRNIVMFDGNGESYSIPDVYTSFTLRLKEYDKEELVTGDHIQLFPNPVSSELNVYINKNDKLLRSELYNSSGALISDDLYNEEKRLSMNVSHLKSGMYFMRLTTVGGTFTKKVYVNN